MLISYTSNVLRSIWVKSRHIFYLTNINIHTRSHIISLGIRKDKSLRCYRRSRAGKNIFKWLHVLLTEHCGTKILHTWNSKVIKKIMRYTTKPETLSICLINPRSCNNKTALMKQFINDLDLDICAIKETWLKESDEISKTALKPEGYEILSSLCPIRLGGGIAIIYKKELQITKSHEYQFETCECMDFKISFDQCLYTLGLFYRLRRSFIFSIYKWYGRIHGK